MMKQLQRLTIPWGGIAAVTVTAAALFGMGSGFARHADAQQQQYPQGYYPPQPQYAPQQPQQYRQPQKPQYAPRQYQAAPPQGQQPQLQQPQVAPRPVQQQAQPQVQFPQSRNPVARPLQQPRAPQQGQPLAHPSAQAHPPAQAHPSAQVKGQPVRQPQARPPAPAGRAVPASAHNAAADNRAEVVQADVSTRRVAVTSSFTGQEIVVFGAVHNSRQPNAASGYYDVVVVVEGPTDKIVARKKARIAGIWINDAAIEFDNVPSYYGISTTRPLDEITSNSVADELGIGFQHLQMTVAPGGKHKPTPEEVTAFKQSVVRLKQDDKLYLEKDYGVAFIASSLFRTSIKIPANAKVGTFKTIVYLFREGKLLSEYQAHLKLEREGIELALHTFAFDYPLWYGLFALFAAIVASLAASRFFGDKSH